MRRWPLRAAAVGVFVTVGLNGCSHVSEADQVAQAVTAWHKSFVSDNGKSCPALTSGGQEELQMYASAKDCDTAAAHLLEAFTSSDRDGFLHVKVDSSKIQIVGNQALVAAGAITYTPQPVDTVALSGPITLTRTDGKRWQLDGVVYVPEH